MDKVVPLASCPNLALVYYNYRESTQAYEGWMRSDFRAHKIAMCDRVELVRLTKQC